MLAKLAFKNIDIFKTFIIITYIIRIDKKLFADF
jgi:hypothetical protein